MPWAVRLQRMRSAVIAEPQPSGSGDPPEQIPAPSGLRGLSEAIGLPAAPSAPTDPLLGRDIGDVTIVRHIADGGMGRVYEGLQRQPRRRVAVKVIRPGLISLEAYRRFAHESELLGRLRHPCIAQIFCAGICEVAGAQVPYFVMEYIPDALPITQYAARHFLPPDAVLEVFRKLCDAVAHGHAEGVIHRDLKPTNILVAPDGAPKIIDFGVARSVGGGPGSMTTLTEMGQLIGTLQYMSPEQFGADHDAIDTRSDVYALGVILYELLTGRPPYEIRYERIFEAARIVRDERPISPARINRKVDPTLAMIVGICLEKNPSKRYADAAELTGAVAAYLAGRPVPRPPRRWLQEGLDCARRRRGAALPVALGLLLLGSLPLAVSGFRPPAPPAPVPPAATTIDWEAISGNSAAVESDVLQPVPLQVGPAQDGWQRVPKNLTMRPAVILAGRTGRDGGVADFRVTRSGVLLLACNFSYQGNSSGDWKEKRWTKEQFQDHGWRLLDPAELGGLLIKGDGREQDVFMKEVTEGDEFRLRCNKYDPPFVIVFESP